MIVKRMVLKNFASFHGYALDLEEGFNLILGPSGCGKTNLARAFKFAVLGQTDVPWGRLINIEHQQKCSEKRQNPFCQVEVTLHKGKDLHAQRTLRLVQNEITESATVDLGISDILTGNLGLVCLSPMSAQFEEDNELPSGVRLINAVVRNLERNVALDIKIVILDGIFGHLSNASAENLFSHIKKMGLDQTVILESMMKPAFEGRVRTFFMDLERWG